MDKKKFESISDRVCDRGPLISSSPTKLHEARSRNILRSTRFVAVTDGGVRRFSNVVMLYKRSIYHVVLIAARTAELRKRLS